MFLRLYKVCGVNLKKIYSLNIYRWVQTEENINKIRNIGVIAHIDAGKTTTTERMLYYSGHIQHIGNVDDGNTVMDYMDQERERGITITSAAITFYWKNFHVNLIDTPGHVDFTIEVERALRVLDGAVAIFDASAGVEAQSLTVWRQANRYNIPRISYINKMDKFGANFSYCLKSIEKQLNTIPVPLQYPIGKEKTFIGVVDLIHMNKLTWNNPKSKDDDGKTFETSKLTENDPDYANAIKYRMNLIEKLAQVDEKFAEILLDKYDMKYEAFNDHVLLETYLRKACLNSSLSLVLCGSSFKNIAVQPLLDAIVKYLPSPSEREYEFVKYYGNQLCALCFKTLHKHTKLDKKLSTDLDKETGSNILTFVRVYNGQLHAKSNVYNATKDVKEYCEKAYIPYANDMKPIHVVPNGNIAVITGLKHSVTGDTLVGSEKSFKTLIEKEMDKDKKFVVQSVMAGLQIPPPVYFCTIEVNSQSEETKLQYALKCLQREDPSLRVTYDDNEGYGQVIIQGMGELHLDIIKERIKKEYSLDVYFGPLEIAYKEKPDIEVTELLQAEKLINGKKNSVTIELTLIPKKDHVFEEVQIIKTHENPFSDLTKDQLKAINHGVKAAFNTGILLRYPIVDADVHMTVFNTSRSTFLPYVSSIANQCIKNALKKSNCYVIQPIMNLEITTLKEYASKVVSDLNKRHSQNIQHNIINETTIINAKTPLARLNAYSSDIRVLTSGHTTFSIEFDSYQQITQKEYQELVDKLYK